MTAAPVLLRSVAEADPEPVDPNSITPRLFGDWRLLLLLPNALVLQGCHPVIGAGVADHSVFKTDPWGRFTRSFWPTVALAFYGDRTADFGRNLRAMHRRIGGIDHRGRRYHAWEPEAYFFVLATGFNAVETVADRFGRGLTQREREELYAGVRQMGRLAGLRERDLPADLNAFRHYFDHVVNDRLENHPTAHDVLAVLGASPPPPHVPRRLWGPLAHPVVGPLATLVTVGTLRPVVRDRLGLPWTPGDERRLRAFATAVRAVNAVLPQRARRISQVIAMRHQDEIIATMARQAELASR